MKVSATRRMQVCHLLQLVLVLLTFWLDFGHGIVLGEHNIAFDPIYRLRQSLAIAISRMHNPPAGGYLAYQSVIEPFAKIGFAFGSEKGLHLDANGWHAVYKDPAKFDRALQDAKNIKIDPHLPPQILRGNELGYADYMYMAFRLFGLHLTSLYYFYFVLLAIACALFLLEYGRSPFFTFMVASYLAGLFFLQNYAQPYPAMASLANSRTFDALSLLPAMHIFIAIWRRLPLRPSTLATVCAQAIVLVFLVGNRTAAVWQVAMIIAAGIAVALLGMWRERHTFTQWKGHFWIGWWPAALTITSLVMLAVFMRVHADSRYKDETGYHGIWHSTLVSILEASPRLRSIYVGDKKEGADQIGYDAVENDLTRRHDMSSPIAYITGKDHISIDLERSISAYDALARSLVLRIIIAHPLDVLDSIPLDFTYQMNSYDLPETLTWPNLSGAALMTAIAGLLWMLAENGPIKIEDAASGIAATSLILACSLIPPFLAPSPLSVGTLLSFLLAIAIGFFVAVYSVLIACQMLLMAVLRAPKAPAEASHSV